MDSDRLTHSWHLATEYGDQFVAWFYGDLFNAHPEVPRSLFPGGMAAQRTKILKTLGMVVANAHQIDRAVPRLQKLGRDHRRYGAQPEFYDAVGDSLLATLQRFLGEAWTPDLAADWANAFNLVASVMRGAADAASEAGEPAWWDLTVAHREPNGDWTRLWFTPPPRFPAWTAGQRIDVSPRGEPGLWAEYAVHGSRADPSSLLVIDVDTIIAHPILGAMADLHPGDTARSGAPFDPPHRQEDQQ